MLFDIISPIVFAVDLLLSGSPLDAELTRRSPQKVAACFPNRQVVRLTADAVSSLLDDSVPLINKPRNLQHAEGKAKRNDLVQDRLAGAMVRHGRHFLGSVSQS